jgi:hypothetical protein
MGSGLDDPGSIDEVRVPRRGPVELVIHHDGRWDGSDQRQILLQEKVNRYLEHVVDGELVAQHPTARGRRWVVVVECGAAPDARTAAYLQEADAELRRAAGGGATLRLLQAPRQ